MSLSLGPVGPVGWGGGEPAIGLAGQPPAALMDRPMMGPAHQGQVGQIGRATMQPVPQMMGLTPGQGPLTAREHTATVTDGQGGPLGGLNDPGGPADLQRLGRGHRPGPGATAPPPPATAPPSSPAVGAVVGSGSLVVGSIVVVVVAAGLAGDQHPGQGTITSQPPTPSGSSGPTRQPHRPGVRGGRGGCPAPPSPSAGAGPHRPGVADPPPRPGGPTPPAHQPDAGPRCGCRWRRLGRPAAPGQRADSDQPRVPTAHPRPPSHPRSRPATPAAADAAARVDDRPPPDRRPGTDGQRPAAAAAGNKTAAAASTGSAAAVTWSDRPWVPWASTAAWATESSPPSNPSAVAVSGTSEQRPGRPHKAGRGAGPQPQPAPEPASGRADLLALVGPGGPRPSTAANCWSQWPSSRSTSPRRTRTARPTPHRSAGPGPGRPTRPRPRPAPSAFLVGGSSLFYFPVECVFELHGRNSYQPGTRTQPPSANLGTTLLAGVGAGIAACLPARSRARLVPGERTERDPHHRMSYPHRAKPKITRALAAVRAGRWSGQQERAGPTDALVLRVPTAGNG